MGKARDLARVIVDSSGAIAAGNLGNAIPADGSITTAKLANGAVTSTKLDANAVVQKIDGWASLDYISTSGTMVGLFSIVSPPGSDRGILPFNTVQDPHDILGTVGSNQFKVNSTGVYLMQGQLSEHNDAHQWSPYLYNDTDDRWAETPNSSYNGASGVSYVYPGYDSTNDPLQTSAPHFYWLIAGKNYSVRRSNEANAAGLGTSTSYLARGYTINGVPAYHSVMRCTLYRLRGY